VATSQPSDGIPGAAAQGPRGTPANPVAVQLTSQAEPSISAFKILGDALLFVAPLAQMFIVVIFVIFMLVNREDLRDRLIRLVGHGQLTLTTQALDDAATRVSKYLLAQSMINGIFGIVVGAGLYFLGVPNGPLWGLLCALLRFIPYLGVWIGAIFPIVLSFVVPEGAYALRPFLTISLFVVTELTAANIAEPLLFGASTGVSSLAILVAAVFWTWLWGGIGLLLSTPLTVILVVVGKYVPQMQFLDVLLGDQPVLRPFERYYQRLLAEDAEEADDLLEDFAKTRSPRALYEEIILPALQTAERDFRHGILDEEHRDAIRQAIGDEIDLRRQQLETSLRENAGTNAPTPAISPAASPTTGNDGPDNAAIFAVPKGCVINILCLPAHDKSDAIAAGMLALLLSDQNYTAIALSKDALASEMVDSVEKLKADVVVISALPPGATAHARYLCKRLHAKYPEIPMLAGLWGVKGDLAKARDRIACGAAMRISTDFDDALLAIHQMVQSKLMTESETVGTSQPTK
jgi:hypothetical protein